MCSATRMYIGMDMIRSSIGASSSSPNKKALSGMPSAMLVRVTHTKSSKLNATRQTWLKIQIRL